MISSNHVVQVSGRSHSCGSSAACCVVGFCAFVVEFYSLPLGKPHSADSPASLSDSGMSSNIFQVQTRSRLGLLSPHLRMFEPKILPFCRSLPPCEVLLVFRGLRASFLYLLVHVEHILEKYHLLVCLMHLLHNPLRRDGVVQLDELCAWVDCQSQCCLSVASMVDSIAARPSLSWGLAQVFVAVLAILARVVSRVPSPAQI